MKTKLFIDKSFPKVIILVFLVLIPKVAFSQLDGWANYTNGDWVTKILNDGEYLWIATDGGLVKMNKNTYEKKYYNCANSGLPENHLINLAKDKNGSIWVTTKYNSVGRMVGDKFERLKLPVNDSPNGQFCTGIAIDKSGNKWISSLMWLNKYDDDSWQSWTTPGSMGEPFYYINCLKFDEDGVLWLGGQTTGWSLAKFANDEIETFPARVGYVMNIEVIGQNKWLATNKGLVLFDGKDFVSYTTENSAIPSNNLYDVKKDISNNIWLACSRFLVKFDGTNFTRYETPLIDSAIYFIEFDEEGNIWLGTRNNKLIKFSDGDFKQFDISNSPLLTNRMTSNITIGEDHSVWFGTNSNLVKIDSDNNWHSFYENIDMYSSISRINATGIDLSGNLWVALGRSDTCALKISGNNILAFTEQNSPLLKQSINSFHPDKKGNMWFATKRGLYKYDGTEWEHFTPKNSPLLSSIINRLDFDKDGNLWGASGSDGLSVGCLFKYDGNDWNIYTLDNSGLPTDFITLLKFDSKNNLWIHCRDKENRIGYLYGGGLTKFDGTTWESFTIYNSGLPSNSIMDMQIDRDDNIWLATTASGLTKFDGKNWTSYSVDNSGIAFNEISHIAIDYSRDLIWLTHDFSSGISSVKMNLKETGIEYITGKNQEQVFTVINPVTDKMTLRFKEGFSPESLEILDLSGKVIAFRKVNHVDLEYSVLLSDINIRESGLYFIKVSDGKGAYVQKLLVK